MHAFELMGPKGAGEVRPVYAIFGDDAYLRREATRAIVRAAMDGGEEELGVSRFPGAQAELAAVLDEVRTLPFLAPRRVAIVEDADPFVTAHRKELEAFAARPSPTGVLVLSVKSWPSNTKLAKLVEQHGVSVECKAPRESELAGWLSRLASTRWGLGFPADAARLLIELVGPEPGLLAAEVDKLASFVGEGKGIARDDVAKMVGAGRVLEVWDMIDRASSGDAPGALGVLDRLLASGEAPQRLLAALAISLRKVHHAGALRRARRDLADACKRAGVWPRDIEKVGRQHAHLGPERVDRLPALLLETDLALKGSSTLDERSVLERLVVDLARPRRD
ncbi:DNA polymerase III subunit delta [Tautonia sociabilis]|uniref:DNA polymerase III subunit delta n=1 Tax=Tautonia sociabilis TaxID=2080755 RepID=A0A432MED1_9BACT|nr:DNA polymerase III subunit delta [Tautonia sociabilis]RUL83771.1 DNA polymerase III subunit delta [Tautonia sociabilis]